MINANMYNTHVDRQTVEIIIMFRTKVDQIALGLLEETARHDGFMWYLSEYYVHWSRALSGGVASVSNISAPWLNTHNKGTHWVRPTNRKKRGEQYQTIRTAQYIPRSDVWCLLGLFARFVGKMRWTSRSLSFGIRCEQKPQPSTIIVLCFVFYYNRSRCV